MNDKIDEGRSILNAINETPNPYGLVLSQRERDFIYGALNKLDHRTSSLLDGRTGWRPQMWATLRTLLLFVGVGAAALSLRHYFDMKISVSSIILLGVSFFILEKLNLLLTHESIDGIFARQDREERKEAAERARHFRDMGTTDMTSDELPKK